MLPETRVAEMTATIAPAVLHSVLRGTSAAAVRTFLGARRTRGHSAPGPIRDGASALRAHAVVGVDRTAAYETNRGTASIGLAARFGRSRRDRQGVGRTDRPASGSTRARRRRPSWTGRAEGLKRWTEGRAVNADPWRLFPAWLRDQLPVPPGDSTPKARKLDFLAALQARQSLWVAVRGHDEKAVWTELRDAGLKPWIHRRITTSAKLPADTDLTAFESYRSGHLIAHDIASQAVAMVCDPDPGERWWDVNAESGLHSLHLAALMKGKGLVVATFEQESRRKATALRLRTSPFHNVTTRTWDGRHVAGKAASYDGVLVEAPSSGIGTWRRNPDARWTTTADQIPGLAARQLQWLAVTSTAVKPGGTLVYTVATVTRSETVNVVNTFLETHPEFTLQPFAHPLEDSKTVGTLQLWPQFHDGEGRFIARMTRVATPPKEA